MMTGPALGAVPAFVSCVTCSVISISSFVAHLGQRATRRGPQWVPMKASCILEISSPVQTDYTLVHRNMFIHSYTDEDIPVYNYQL
ncbi:hypothetical protein CHS0354_011338 [Potamilus streckersoni]|uniref:Uncharacterized protein n=1 Tax=Potamilus streckersoni TaxID=2493646 RepID=A0AAE0SFG3_9BIVA|nr:hypothetical protein CHS0354_011338 [Potamilus streckersoni]